MKFYIVKYSRTCNIQKDGRKKPIWETFTGFQPMLYESIEEAKEHAWDCYDSFEIYEAPLTLVKETETAE